MEFCEDLVVFLWYFLPCSLMYLWLATFLKLRQLNTIYIYIYIRNVMAPRLKFTRSSSVCYLYILHFLFLRRSFLSFSDISLSKKSLRATNSQSTCLSALVYLVMHQVFHSARFEVSTASNFEKFCLLTYAPCNLVNFFQHSGWISLLHYNILWWKWQSILRNIITQLPDCTASNPKKKHSKSSVFSFVMKLFPSHNSHFVPL